MDFFSAAEIISSGMSAERTLMNTTASNLANAQTTRSADGGPYKRLDPVFEASAPATFGQELNQQMEKATPGVEVTSIQRDERAPRLVYDPSHPDADKNGYVAMPNVNMVEEMVNMMTASRAYEAGVHAMTVISSMSQHAMTIGK